MKRVNIHRVNEDDTMVHAYSIIGTNIVVFSAWKPVGTISGGSAGTFTTHAGKVYGRIGTDPDRAMFDGLKPMTKERLNAVREAYKQRKELAVKIIHQTFPELGAIDSCDNFNDGEVVTLNWC